MWAARDMVRNVNEAPQLLPQSETTPCDYPIGNLGFNPGCAIIGSWVFQLPAAP